MKGILSRICRFLILQILHAFKIPNLDIVSRNTFSLNQDERNSISTYIFEILHLFEVRTEMTS